MSLGGFIGTVVGGVTGFFIGGPTGALYGAGLGFGVGVMIDPIAADTNFPGTPSQELDITPNEVGTPIPDLTGTAKITGHLICYGGERSVAVKKKVKTGKGGSKKKKVVVGHKYYASWVLGISREVDTLCAVYRNDGVCVWEGMLAKPTSGGHETIILGEDMGSMDFYFGTNDQEANPRVGALLDDPTLNTPYRGLCWAFFDDNYIGDYNRIPTMKFIVRKTPTPPFAAEKASIQEYDYNPAHSIWYVFCEMLGLPESWLDTTGDFTSVAETLNSENRGMSILFDRQNSALSYLENINLHIDSIIRYGNDGKFHPKLIRNDYNTDTLPVVDESVMLDTPSFGRKSWIDTVNEVKVQYTELFK
jgi:hypothetical protein